MARKKKSVAIRIPLDDGSYRYVSGVNVGDLNVGTLTQLFERSKDKDGHRWIPLSGMETVVNTGLDMTGMQETLQTILDQYEAVFAASDEGKKLWDEVIATLDFKGVFAAIGSGEMVNASFLWQDVLYKLLSAFSELVTLIGSQGRTLSGTYAAIDRHVETDESRDDVTTDFLLEWATSAIELVRVVNAISSIEI